MGIKTFKLGAILLLILFVSGCSSRIKLPETKEVSQKQAKSDWQMVLDNFVTADGKVDFNSVKETPDKLENWLYSVARQSPVNAAGLYPTKDHELAFYLDAYNGLAMYGVINAGVFPQDKVRFFLLRKYEIGGQWMSLYWFENTIIRGYQEPRIHFALNCMSIGCPRLPKHTWNADTLEQQLEDAAWEFNNDKRHVYFDKAQHRIYLSEIYDFFTEDFTAHNGDLISYVNQYRSEQIPTDAEIVFIPYDWSLIGTTAFNSN